MVRENHPNPKQLPWQRRVTSPLFLTSLAFLICSLSVSPHSWPPPILRPHYLLISLHHITRSTQKPKSNTHTHTHKNMALSLSLPCSSWASQPPSPCPLTPTALCLKKNKPVEKNTEDKKQQPGFGIARSLSSPLHFVWRFLFHTSFWPVCFLSVESKAGFCEWDNNMRSNWIRSCWCSLSKRSTWFILLVDVTLVLY